MKQIHKTAWAPVAAILLSIAACNSDKSPEPAPSAKPAAGPSAAAEPAAAAPVAAAADKAELGKPAPAFTLKDLDGKEHSLAQYKGKVVVLEWFSPGCPMCKWAYAEGGPLAEDGVVWLAINSEAAKNKPASPEMNREFAEKYGMKSPILFDPTGTVGRSYGAKTTPHVYVIDEKGTLVYRGALDNAPGGKVSGDGDRVDYVGNAVADIKAGRPVKVSDTKAYG
jgi:peroxiredoxin